MNHVGSKKEIPMIHEFMEEEMKDEEDGFEKYIGSTI